MTAQPDKTSTLRKIFRVRNLFLLAIGVAYLWASTRSEAFFNDENYANMRADMNKVLAYPDGSPEQAVSYMYFGKHLKTPIYYDLTGYDVCKWSRDPENPIRPILARHRLLKN